MVLESRVKLVKTAYGRKARERGKTPFGSSSKIWARARLPTRRFVRLRTRCASTAASSIRRKIICGPEVGDFSLQECSPCAPFSPPNPGCALIGAWPVGCGGTPVTPTTWGAVKAMFRQ